MSAVHRAPYGSWKSPITTELIARKVISLMDVAVDGEFAYCPATGKVLPQCQVALVTCRSTNHQLTLKRK